MPSYRYVGPDNRYYPTFGIEALPGQAIDLPGDAPTDGRWLEVTPGSATVTVAAELPAPAEPAPAPAAVAVADAIPAPAEPAPAAAPEVSA